MQSQFYGQNESGEGSQMATGVKQYVPMMPIRPQSDQQYPSKITGSTYRPADSAPIAEKAKAGSGMSLKSSVYEPQQ